MEKKGVRNFEYTYSAKEQAELHAIRKKYMPAEENEMADKLALLRRLDAGVTKKAMVVALTLGVIGTLVLGLGMSLIMTDLAAILGILSHAAISIGILIGAFGIAGVIAAYPIYQRMITRERRRLSPRILQLTDSLLEK